MNPYTLVLLIILTLILIPFFARVIIQHRLQYTQHYLASNQPFPKRRGIYVKPEGSYLVFKDYDGWAVGECDDNGVVVGVIDAL
jgi:hypothetical protein